MSRTWFTGVLVLGFLAACTAQTPSPTATASPTTAPPTYTPPPAATPQITASVPPDTTQGHPGLPLVAERNDLFATSGLCAACHTKMVDGNGAEVSIDSFWRATMMANASRDPYWQASVRSEILHNPSLKDAIEDKCATCHMPMAHFPAAVQETSVRILDGGLLAPATEGHGLAIDGVSCTVCHQIQKTDLGQRTSFSGGFVIDSRLPFGERPAYGPYTIDPLQSDLMKSVSGFEPIQGPHLSQSEVCATCHVVFTQSVDADGKAGDRFPEQVVYLEWFYSDYRQTHQCQDCHMPQAAGGVKIATTSPAPRSPFSKHVFVGGNSYLLSILRLFPEEIAVTASSDQFLASANRTLDQLQNRTASLVLEDVRLAANRLTAEVVVSSQAGHKFPSGYPSRRAWLHFTVWDGSGEIIFESGAVNPDGSIRDNDNDVDPTRFELHRDSIARPNQVQIYEAIMKDAASNVTTGLLRAAGYLKDNRLLPSGFEKTAPFPDIAVWGLAWEDENFAGGQDRVTYSVDLGSSEGPFTVTVELLYQSIGFRWAENLRSQPADEVETFLRFYDAVPNLPVLIAVASEDNPK